MPSCCLYFFFGEMHAKISHFFVNQLTFYCGVWAAFYLFWTTVLSWTWLCQYFLVFAACLLCVWRLVVFTLLSADVKSSGRGLRVTWECGTRNKAESIGTPCCHSCSNKGRMAWLSLNVRVSQEANMSVCLSTFLSVSVYLSIMIYLSINLSIYLSIIL